MTSREEQNALMNVARLLAKDLSKLDVEDLISGALQARKNRKESPQHEGRFLAELHRRGYSWPDIEKATGIKRATAYRRAADYL